MVIKTRQTIARTRRLLHKLERSEPDVTTVTDSRRLIREAQALLARSRELTGRRT
jgi:hypothetical protein